MGIACDFSGGVLDGTDRAEEFKQEAFTLQKMRADYDLFNSQLKILKPQERQLFVGFISREMDYGMIADEMAIGMINKKTTAVRIIPAPNKKVGDTVVFGGLLGEAPIMNVNTLSSENFVNRGGRIPAPIHSLNN